jgi:hypothetical protein
MMTQPIQSQLLAECAERFRAAITRAETLCAGLSQAQANFKPEPKRWSVAECLEHLSTSMTSYLPHLQRAVERARAANRTGSEPWGKGTFFGRFILNNMVKGPTHMKVKAPPPFRPEVRSEWDLAEVLQRFKERTGEMLALLEQADGLDLGRIKQGTPMPMVKVTLAQSFEIHSRHNHRHLDQAQRVTEHDSFPA